mgnify:CR=1 FL=1
MSHNLAASSIVPVNQSPIYAAGDWLPIPAGAPANAEALNRLSQPTKRQKEICKQTYVVK